VSHRNARLTPYARRKIAELVEAGHKPGEVAKQFHVSRTSVYKWVRRWQTEGEAGLQGRSSRPRTSPRQISVELTQQIIAARVAEHVGARELSVLTGVPASTIGAVLRRAGMPHLADVDRVTGELLRGRRHSDRRYEHDRPGSLLHVDVKKLGKIPPGGGHRAHGRSEDVRGRGLGWDFVHVAVDDHSRLAYAEVLSDERATTCAAFLHRAVLWFRQHGVVVRRVLTDNAKSYTISHAWREVCIALQIKRRYIKSGCPWTNGKAERFNRTLQDRWAYRQTWTSNDDRTAALADFLIFYNTVRGHTSLGGQTPISRLAA
jgi:transposase InsO family protein/transposase